LADLLAKHPATTNQIGSVWYYGTAPDAQKVGWNTARDMASAKAVFASGLPLRTVALPEDQLPRLDDAFLEEVARANTVAARLITALHRDARVRAHLREPQVRAWDDTLALALLKPSLAQWTLRGETRQELGKWDAARSMRVYAEVLGGAPYTVGQRPLVTLRSFPLDPADYREDLAPLVREILERHGEEEWKVVVLTNELHRHLGLYSIIGAKMGLRAREILGADLDDLQLESLASLQPPLSCLNDGLQVATGSSLGRGTIRVNQDGSSEPSCIFQFKDRRIKLRLKDEVVRRIRADIRAAIEQHGNLTPAYFQEIRRNALRGWRDLDRREIFEETELGQ